MNHQHSNSQRFCHTCWDQQNTHQYLEINVCFDKFRRKKYGLPAVTAKEIREIIHAQITLNDNMKFNLLKSVDTLDAKKTK